MLGVAVSFLRPFSFAFSAISFKKPLGSWQLQPSGAEHYRKSEKPCASCPTIPQGSSSSPVIATETLCNTQRLLPSVAIGHMHVLCLKQTFTRNVHQSSAFW
jgi:hypothetical protein